MMKEFKEFALKGNVMDMAVGIIIGAAFGKIIASLVENIIMPPVGILLGGVDFSDLAYTLKEAVPAAEGIEAAEAVVIQYGVFFNTIIQFVIIALSIFMVIKAMNSAKKAEEEAPEEEPETPADQVLLAEIRDLLKK